MRETTMPRGDKSSYSDKQKRQAEHIEEGYEHRGVGKKEAERRAWATVNKETGGGNKSGSGRGVPDTNVSAKRGGRIGGRAAARHRPGGRPRRDRAPQRRRPQPASETPPKGRQCARPRERNNHSRRLRFGTQLVIVVPANAGTHNH
jgi:plasmid stabilization system protein ParE